MRHGVIEKQVAHTTMATVALPRSGFKAQALLAGLGLAASRPFQVPRCLLGTAFWSWPEHRARSWRSWPTQSSRQARTFAVIEQLSKLGVESNGTTPEEFSAQIAREQPQFDLAMRAANLSQP